MFGRELHGKLPKRIVPTKEVSSDKIWQWDKSEKKEYADKRIVIGDTVLLKQNKADMLTPAYDPSPYTVMGLKGIMVVVKRRREIKAQNL